MKIVFLGMGEVAKCVLHLIDHFVEFGAHRFFIIERKNETTHQTVNAFIGRGARYLQRNLTAENIRRILEEEIGIAGGDLVVDLTTDTDMFHTVRLALENGWLYLNTCIENSADAELIHHRNHEKMRALVRAFAGGAVKSTCLFDHGMNPGLISSFVKKGLLDIARLTLKAGKRAELQPLIADRDFSALAEAVRLRVLHCSELDDQRGNNVPQDIFVNTWSCPGFIVEATAPTQLTLGTHERSIPAGGVLTAERHFVSDGAAWATRARSYVPNRPIEGMVIPHEEVITLTRLLARPGYVPTICYVYEVNPHTQRCFDIGLLDADTGRVITPGENSLSGSDRVGALFILEKNPVTEEPGTWSYWCGSILETTDPIFSATVIQVAAGVLSAMRWMMENPARGVLFPEDLPHETILRYASPYLGEIYSGAVEFSPGSLQWESFLSAPSGIPSHPVRR